MNAVHKKYLEQELALAQSFMREGEDEKAFGHLERAHVLGQQNVRPHVLAHWLMLRIAVKRRDPVAVAGQVVRILLGTLGSAVGVVPIGNTGGTNVGMFKRMPIEPELLKIMQLVQ